MSEAAKSQTPEPSLFSAQDALNASKEYWRIDESWKDIVDRMTVWAIEALTQYVSDRLKIAINTDNHKKIFEDKNSLTLTLLRGADEYYKPLIASINKAQLIDSLITNKTPPSEDVYDKLNLSDDPRISRFTDDKNITTIFDAVKEKMEAIGWGVEFGEKASDGIPNWITFTVSAVMKKESNPMSNSTWGGGGEGGGV